MLTLKLASGLTPDRLTLDAAEGKDCVRSLSCGGGAGMPQVASSTWTADVDGGPRVAG